MPLSSNLAYALAGSLLREWLTGPPVAACGCAGSTTPWPAVLVATAIWMLLYMSSNAHISKGLWLGLLGIVIFSVTLPMTRLAVGTPEAPQMAGVFIALGRAVVAAALSAVFLLATRAPFPRREQWRPLAVTAGGVVFGFPLFTSIAMRHVEAMHASVIVGVLPLATAAVGALLHRQRPSAGFGCARPLGSALVVAFAMLRSGGGSLSISPADLLLLAAMLCAAVGYGYGARLSQAYAGRARDLLGAAAGPAADLAAGRFQLANGAHQGRRPGGASATSRCSRCGWAFSAGTVAWRWAARCA